MIRRSRAFTLVELLTVITVVAVLISLLLPAINNAKLMARRTMCMSNLHSMGNALGSYGMSYKDYAPLGFDGAIGTNRSGEDTVWVDGLTGPSAFLNGYWGPGLLVSTKFLDSPEALFCPERRGTVAWNDYAVQRPNFGKTGQQCWATYYHRNDNDNKLYGGLGINVRLSKEGSKAWVSDLGSFFYAHPTLPQFSRGRGHTGGFNTLYLDGVAIWVADTKNTLQYDGDGGPPTNANSWAVLDSKR